MKTKSEPIWAVRVLLTGCSVLDSVLKVQAPTREQASDVARRYFGAQFVRIKRIAAITTTT